MLPEVKNAQTTDTLKKRRLLIIAEGFEKRSLSWIGDEKNQTTFEDSIICKYEPARRSRFEEMVVAVNTHCVNEPVILSFNRFQPTLFEQDLIMELSDVNIYEEVVIDISVMSKLLIMIVIESLRKYCGSLRIIYSEPESWGPTKKKYEETVSAKTYGTCIGLSSVGVDSIVKTPSLSSIIMQNSPILLVGFLSFNEQLLNVIVSELSPTKLCIINHSCSRVKWREKAMLEIHRDLIESYYGKKEIDDIKSFDVTDYRSVFEYLASIYRNYCYSYRIVSHNA